MSKKAKNPANHQNENPASQSGQSVELINDIKKLELQHVILNKMLNSNKKPSEPAIPNDKIPEKGKNQ